MPSSTDRRAYIRAALAQLFSTIQGIMSFQEVLNENLEFPRGSYRTGSTSFRPTSSRKHELGDMMVLAKIEFSVPEGEPLDALVGSIEKQIEKAIHAYTYPLPFEDDIYSISIKKIERLELIPSLVRELNQGVLIVPISVTFDQHWK